MLSSIAFIAVCQHDHDKNRISLATATPGGGFPLFGGAAADTINETDPTLNVVPRNTKGSAENIGLPLKWRGGTGSPIRAVAVFED